MREVLIFASIILGQLMPNASILTQIENKLRLENKATTVQTAPKVVDRVPESPRRVKIEDYAASAKAIYSIDLASNAVLMSKDTDQRLQVASLTKLMTAYVILKDERDLNKVVTVPALAPQPGDSTMGISTGESLTIRALLDGLLITSGSDAAQTLAIDNAGSMDAFVSKMNTATAALDLPNTQFANPVGWDSPDNYSTAKDMTELTRILLRSDVFREIVTTQSKVVTTTSDRQITLHTTNQLLGNPGYAGVKTGYTYGAGECLISLYKRDNAEVLTTVIGSTARFYETESIKGWILEHFSW